MKKKTMAFVMSLLMIVALVGVGFATWVITADSKETVEGNITVDTVVDTRIKLTAQWGTTTDGTLNGFTASKSANVVHFGKASQKEVEAMGTDNKWLSNDGDASIMELYLKVSLEKLIQEVTEGEAKKTYGLTADGITLSLDDTNGKYDTAETATYVGAIADVLSATKLYLHKTSNDVYFLSTTEVDTTLDVENGDVEVKSGKADVLIKLTFKWGAKFGNVNPYVFYNAHKAEDEYSGSTYVEDAKTALAGLNALNAETFKLTITAKGGAITALK